MTLPSGLKAGFRLASVSTVVPGRMPSSVVTSSLDLDDVAGLLVEALLGDPDDLVVEAALGGGALGALLALGAEGVELLAGDAPLVGDHLGRDALGHEAGIGVAGEDLVAERDRARGHRRAHRRGGHDLDAGGDGDVVGTGDHALGGEVGGLLGRAALAVDRGGGHRLGEPGGEHGVAADVEALVPDLHDAAHDHVVDERGVEVVALDEALQDLAGEVGRVPPRQLSVALATRSADGVDDDGGGHGLLLRGHLTGRSSVAGRHRRIRNPRRARLEWCRRHAGRRGGPMREITRDELDAGRRGPDDRQPVPRHGRAPTPTRSRCARSSPTAPTSSGPSPTTPSTWPARPPTSRGSGWGRATASC